MTNIEQKSLELVNEVSPYECVNTADANHLTLIRALRRAIERHEAFRQEVSDAVEAVFAGYHDAPIPWVVMRRKLDRFIIAKPNPVEEAAEEALNQPDKPFLESLRAALAKRGGRIVFDD